MQVYFLNSQSAKHLFSGAGGGGGGGGGAFDSFHENLKKPALKSSILPGLRARI